MRTTTFKGFFAILVMFLSCIASALPPEFEGLGLREHAVASRDMPGWQSPGKVVVLNRLGDAVLSQLEAAAPGAEIVPVTSLEAAREAVATAQVLIGVCDQSVFAKADQLHWVQVFFAGVENCVDLPAMQSGKLVLTNGQRLGSPTLADHAIALMMSLTRGLYGSYEAQLNRRWMPGSGAASSFGEVQGRTMLVVGLGGIGSQVAKRAHGLGMRVIATRNSRREGPDYVEYVGLADEVLELAARADIVVNAAPLTDATLGMFNRQFFEAMKPSAYFISVGRGESTVTADLIEALETGRIAGAALDVTDPEPLPEEHPLWTAPNVVITPHVAGRSREAFARVGTLVVENLRRYAAGEPLLSVVDIQRGY
jgi:phosphoglycerate dehydrogenase-like enzyme